MFFEGAFSLMVISGAFKFRGASNATFSLDDKQAAKGVVTHSRFYAKLPLLGSTMTIEVNYIDFNFEAIVNDHIQIENVKSVTSSLLFKFLYMLNLNILLTF